MRPLKSPRYKKCVRYVYVPFDLLFRFVGLVYAR